MSLRSPASRAGAYAVPPRPRRKWIRHGDLRSALPDTNGMRRFLRFAVWSRRKDLHLRSP